MKNQNRKEGLRLPGFASTEDLRSRQSVRATFRLSSDSIQAIRIVVTQLGIKPKSLFDHLLEDPDSIQKVAPSLQHQTFLPADRIQKTFVISRKSLSFLDCTAREYNAPRDILVESLINRLLPLIAKEQKKHRVRKKKLEQISSHFQSGVTLLNELGRTMEKSDPFYTSMMTAMSNYNKALNDMVGLVEKGRVLEDFSPERMKDLFSG